jgi:hypothetical protein
MGDVAFSIVCNQWEGRRGGMKNIDPKRDASVVITQREENAIGECEGRRKRSETRNEKNHRHNNMLSCSKKNPEE